MENINLPSKKKWVKVKLGDLASTITKGSTPTTYGFNYLDKGIPFIKIENIENDKISYRSIKQFISNEAHEYQSRSQLQEGDILFSIAGTIGKTCIVTKNDIPSNTNQALSIIRGTKKYLLPKFLKLQFLSILSTTVKKKARGGAMSNISLNDLEKMDILLPSIQEQNRIIEKIEELFSDLDKTTEDLKKTQKQLKIYRQAVLKAAFEGKLTEEWRQTRKEASNIKHTTLNNICIKAEKIKNEENSERQIKYLDIGSIGKKAFKIVSHKTYKIKNAPSRAKQIVKEGDTLFSTVRTYLKNIAYVHSEYDNEICSTGFCVIRPKKDVLSSEYIFYYVISDDFVNRVSPLQTGTSYPAVRDDDILKQTIPLVTIEEQEQIVQEIESRLSVCDKLEETIKEGSEKIKYLRQSILKKAFEGKLVQQDPNDEPAEKLLERIKQ